MWERELGPDSRSLAYALTGIGLTYLAQQNSRAALEPLGRALEIRELHESDWAKKGQTYFALARALWDSNRDRGRARTLAQRAKDAYARSSTKLAEVEGWLSEHSTGSGSGVSKGRPD